jgi:pyruvate dehydrogenase E2 component (dihydrolipoamide acetyltransferase)
VAPLKDVLVPDIGDFSDVPVVELLVEAGAEVAVDDPLVVVESDKATMEIPAPFAGTVQELTVAVGDKVSEGTKVAVIALADGAEAEAPAEQRTPPAGRGRGARLGGQRGPGRVAGGGDRRARARAVDLEVVGERRVHGRARFGIRFGYGGGLRSERRLDIPVGERVGAEVHASPVVRRLARERSIDLTTLTGTGRAGGSRRRTSRRRRRAGRGVRCAVRARGGKLPPAGDGERVPLTRIQQISATNLSGAWQTIPHVTQHDDADITELEAFRKQLNSEQSDVKVTMVALLLKAAASALDAFPRFASSLDGDELVMKAERHIAFAADTPKGLMVPVVRDVDQKGLLQLAGELGELSGKARDGKLGPKEMGGAVFTISSLGGIGGTGFTPIVNPPQVAILGVVRSAMQPVWDGAAFQPRLILPLSLSYDHRVIDGALAARFTAHLAKLLTDLRRVLL